MKEQAGVALYDEQLSELVARIASGRQEALAELYDRTAPRVFGLVRQIVSDTEIAEEVTHDVFVQVWRDASAYDVNRGKPSTWLFTLARSRAIDRLRSISRYRKNEEPLEAAAHVASDPDPAQDWALATRRRRVHEALSSLSRAQREVILIAYFRGLSHSEIAEQLGQPLGTVKTRIRLAMIRLREMLEPLHEKE